MKMKKTTFRIRPALGVLAFVTFILIQLLTPVLQARTSAAPTDGSVINLLKYGTRFSTAGSYYVRSQDAPMETCTPAFFQTLEDDTLLVKNIGQTASSLQSLVDNLRPNDPLQGKVDTKIGELGGTGPNGLSIAQAKYILDAQHLNHRVSIIKFASVTNGTQPINADKTQQGTDCSQYEMIRVSDTEWRGYQGVDQTSSQSPVQAFMVFDQTSTNAIATMATNGSFQFYDRIDGGQIVVRHENLPLIQVTGSSQVLGTNDPGTVSSGAAVQFFWLNASQIELLDASSPHFGEIYTKSPSSQTGDQYISAWNQQSDYYLTYVPTGESVADPARVNLTYSRSTSKCDITKSCVDSQTKLVSNNQVPFVHLAIDFSIKNSGGNLQKKMNSLGNSTATYYDYNANGSAGPSAGYHVSFKNAATTAPRIWFIYSQKNDTFLTVFSDGDSNEKPHVGTYAATTTGGTLYKGPGGGCDELRKTGTTNGDGTFGVTWTLKDSSCTNVIGVPLTGPAPLAKLDETLFSALTQNIQQAVSAKTNSTGGAAPELNCVYSIHNPLTWFVCPLVDAAQALIGKLDDAINQQLFIKSDNIFNRSGPTKASADGYYNAWLTFRSFGLGLVAIGGLVSIIAFALGFEIFDAYTVRKVLPRLIIAVIGLSLSWYIMQYLIDFSNSLGLGIRALIYAPFSAIHGGTITLGGGSSVALGIVGGAMALSLGLVGLASLAVTGALAVAVGFGTIIVRNIIVTLLVILAPFAIACAILPNTQKAWKLWSDTFIKALLVFPIITAFIASGRVFALLATAGNDGGIATGLISFVAYFAPYFLISTAFKLAGGVIGTIGGLANNRSRGVFDRLKKGRGNRIQQNMGALKSGTRFSERNALTQGFNRRSAGLATGTKGRFGFGAKGAGALDLNQTAAANERLKDPVVQAAMYDDAVRSALLAGSEKKARAKLSAKGMSAPDIDRAVGTASQVGFNRTSRIAALSAEAQNKSRNFADATAANEEIAEIASDLGIDRERLQNSFSFNARQNGRFDLGALNGDTTTAGRDKQHIAGWAKGSLYQHASAQGTSFENIAKSFEAVGTAPTATDEQREDFAVFFDEANTVKMNATGDVATKTTEFTEGGAPIPSLPRSEQVKNIKKSGPVIGVQKARMDESVINPATGATETRRVDDPDLTHATTVHSIGAKVAVRARKYQEPDPSNR